MKRSQRKKNLKNLLSTGDENNIDERRKLRSAKSGTSNKLVKENNAAEEIEVKHCDHKKVIFSDAENDSAHPETIKRRINLTRFVFPNKKLVPSSVLKMENDSDDFETPVKKIKRAPKLSQSSTGVTVQTNAIKSNSSTNNLKRKKRQQKITTAFLRNEQMFSEVAAQHSLAENFNPDEVQLALALSRSEVETNISKVVAAPVAGAEESIETVQENICDKLKKYGFRTGNKEDYTNCFTAAFLHGQRRTKSKWANKFTALTLRDPNIQFKKINTYVDAILNQQIRTESIVSLEVKEKSVVPFKLQSSIISRCAVVDTVAQIFRNSETLSTTESLERFFITELFPVTKLPAGHLLKNWKAIPGRDLSPKRTTKQSEAQEHRYQMFYEELESCFSKKRSDLHKENRETFENIETVLSKEQESNKEKTRKCFQLDSLPDLNGSTERVLNIENAVHLDEEQHSNLTQTSMECGVTVELKSITSNELCPRTESLTQTRPMSPDLFADSDSDGAEVVEENMLNNITIYEAYSSDDVKTSSVNGCKIDLLSVKADVIVDLTQDDVEPLKENDDDKMIVITPKKQDLSKRLDFLEDPNKKNKRFPNESATNHEENEGILTKDRVCNKLNEKYPKESIQKISNECFSAKNRLKFSKSCSFESTMDKSSISRQMKRYKQDGSLFQNQSVASIDLTQSVEESINRSDDTRSINDSENDKNVDEHDLCILLSDNDDENDKNEDEYNFCILLSDDEVNCSIIKTNAASSGSPELSAGRLSDSYDDKKSDQPEQLLQTREQHNFSVLDFIDVEHSFQLKESISKEFVKNTSFDLSGDIEPINKDYLVSESQNVGCPSTPKKEHSTNTILKQQRAEFGILESQSEDFSQTPSHWTLTRVTPQKQVTPSPSTPVEPLYCRRSYTRKFESFLFEGSKTPDRPERAECDKLDSQLKTPQHWEETPKKKESPTSSANRYQYHHSQRYSRNSYARQFQSFLFEATKSPPNRDIQILPPNEDDFDEFDRLVYGSPPKYMQETQSQPNMPAGLEQLLTAEISLQTQSVRTTSQPESQSSIVLRTLTPEKASKITTEKEIKINNHVYSVRVTNSPKPNFAAQSDAELLKQLYGFGIKPLKRHQAIKILDYIYNETHPIIDRNKLESSSHKISECSSEISSDDKNNVAEKDSDKTKVKSNINKFNLQDCYGDLLLHNASELSAELETDDEIYIFQINVTKKTQHPLVPLHIAWLNLVCSNSALHKSILMFEPIDLQEIYLFLKSLGYRYDPKDLKKFFDSRSILFSYDLTPPEKQSNRHIRKPNKKEAKTKTITTSQTQKTSNSKSTQSQHTLHKYLSL